MAYEGDPEPVSGAERGEGRPEVTALEARVARLETELAELQRRLAAGGASQRTAAAPPPPPPRPVATHLAADATPGPAAPPAEVRDRGLEQPASPQKMAAVGDSLESFESRLGSQIFNRIAIVLLLIGTAYGMKLAVDRGLLGPGARVILGLVGGAGLVVWSERFRNKGFAAFSYSLKAVGSGVLYLSLWAAFQRFHLLPAAAALTLMVLVTAWNAYMAWVQDSELLAGYALVGGFATPLLVSTGGNHEIFLFTYLLAIDVAMVALVRLKTWPRLLLGAFPVTVLFFIGWDSQFFDASELGITAIFIVLFGAAFGSVPVGRIAAAAGSTAKKFASLATVLEDILLPLSNAAFVALAGYSVLQDAGHHAWLPWLMIVLAAAYLGLMQAPQTRTATAIHLSLAVVFLTIAIPLKASGAWITASWLVEGLALIWVATRLAQAGDGAEQVADLAAAQASRVLRLLALASLALGFCGVCAHAVVWSDAVDLPLLNKGTTTALTGIVVFGVAAWLALRSGGIAKAGERGLGWGPVAASAFVLIDLTAVVLAMRELIVSWDWPAYHPPFQTADFLTALIGLAVFAGVIAVSLRVAAERSGESFWMRCAGTSTIVFNLIAVLTGVREIEALWGRRSVTADAGLQQALAISAFLMLYGAALLAAGFWKRSGFLRWQALVLLVFTIFKTFLYDMRNLSQGYRVGSVLGLGALLMAISFAYQKDLLNLRGTGARQASGVDEAAK
jgi:uncharacterized membrane protein